MKNDKLHKNHVCTKEDEYAEPLWVDRDGIEYRCECEITDSHLQNIVNFLERNYESLLHDSFPMLNDDMSQYSAEREYYSSLEEFSDKLLFFQTLLQERVGPGSRR